MAAKFIGLLAIVSVLFPLAGVVKGQQKEIRPLELNVFRGDAATAAGRARGFFAKEGVEVKVTITPDSTSQMRGLSNGTNHIALTGFDNVLAWSGKEGAEIFAVAQGRDDVDLQVFGRPEILDWSDLKGKKLAVDAVDTAYALVLRRVLLAHGLDLNRGDYALVPVGSTRLRAEALIRGETSGTVLNRPFDAQAKAAGMIRLGDSRELLPYYPGSVYAVNRAWAQKQRGDLVGFLRGWLAGIRWVKDPANREEAVKVVAGEIKLNAKEAAEAIDEQSASGALNLPGLQSILDLRVQFGFKLPMGNSLDRYYDAGYFREAGGK
ncbi:MAG TPA: ABC transporter substrate-binding protein [Candidatus Binatia bacterium]